MEVILQLFSKKTLSTLFDTAFEKQIIQSENAQRIYALRQEYLHVLDDVVAFLQGKNASFARQIGTADFLPRASRFDVLDDLEFAFGNMGLQDKAKHLATLFLEDLSDFLVECVDENFGFSRYAERLGRSANSFDELYTYLQQPLTPIDVISLSILAPKMESVQPKLVCFSVPFPGNLYAAFRCAQYIKQHFPKTKIAMGGGFPNTELRSLKDARVFEFFDYITLDDGELPIQLLHEAVTGKTVKPLFKRTFLLENDEVVYRNDSPLHDYKQSEVGTPDYADLHLTDYISVIEIANPMHSLWSDGRWLKLTMAHGCYWGKCTFCDISLDYIKLYEPIAAKTLVDRMEQMIAETGEKGFHFVDEAAPPSLMKALALEILKRDLVVSWWTNIRFEKNFTQDLCKLLKASGCIAVSGGLEVASDRLLQLIDKGVTVEQVAQVTRNFTESGIMVHAYLMYGYPTQTVQETIDSLEMVRQLFEIGVLQSGFWHQFALTAHSPIGLAPSEYGIEPHVQPITFANNDIDFTDTTGIDHNAFSFGLKKSLYNYMHEVGFDLPLQTWFDFKIPRTKVAPDFIANCLDKEPVFQVKSTAKIVWLGTLPQTEERSKTKRGETWHNLHLHFHSKTEHFEIALEKERGYWWIEKLEQLSPKKDKTLTFNQLQTDFETHFPDFELFWFSKPIGILREKGLLVL